jgi:hypothetical protein
MPRALSGLWAQRKQHRLGRFWSSRLFFWGPGQRMLPGGPKGRTPMWALLDHTTTLGVRPIGPLQQISSWEKQNSINPNDSPRGAGLRSSPGLNPGLRPGDGLRSNFYHVLDEKLRFLKQSRHHDPTSPIWRLDHTTAFDLGSFFPNGEDRHVVLAPIAMPDPKACAETD